MKNDTNKGFFCEPTLKRKKNCSSEGKTRVSIAEMLWNVIERFRFWDKYAVVKHATSEMQMISVHLGKSVR